MAPLAFDHWNYSGRVKVNQRVWLRVTAARDQRGTISGARDTPDLREFQRYLSERRASSLSHVTFDSPGSARRLDAKRSLRVKRPTETTSGFHDAATFGFRGIRAYPSWRSWEECAAPPFSFTRVTLRDGFRPISRSGRHRSIIATGRARRRRRWQRPAVLLLTCFVAIIYNVRVGTLARVELKGRKKVAGKIRAR